jgi:2-dehydropantoate 2-reductase
MQETKMAVVGIGATGTVLAAALLSKYPETLLVGRDPDLGNELRSNGIHTSGIITYQVAVKNYITEIKSLRSFRPAFIFLATKTFHLPLILNELKDVVGPGTYIISTQNGLGPEDLIADQFGKQATFRMALNYGAAKNQPGETETIFFNKPNHLGCLAPESSEAGLKIAHLLTECGLDTEFVDDIKLFVWKKMVMKCTMASICAVTDKTIREALNYPPTREIAEACFKEALSVAKAMGYEMGEDYLKQAVSYLEKAGRHKDSMCHDIANKTRTEIDYLGGKVVEYGRANNVATPVIKTMTNLVKALEHGYLS